MTAYEKRISDWISDLCSSDLYVRNTAEGIIDSPRGYVSLGATGIGAAIQEGTVSATTSVSRNSNVSIAGGTVRLGPDSTLRITPDTSAEVIPQGADSVANFKTSKITIGGALSNKIGRAHV